MESMLISFTVSALHQATMPPRMIALVSQDEDTIHAVFGPEMDLAARYVAQVCDSRRVIPGAKLGVVQGSDIAGPDDGATWSHVAVMDGRGKAWALTGPTTDKHAYSVAQSIAEHPAFIEAVTAARGDKLILLGQPAAA